jgi:hypothetical protein
VSIKENDLLLQNQNVNHKVMKKLLLSVILFLSLKAIAQPQITTGTIPQIGGVVTYMNHDTTGVAPGMGGANQNWTFSVINTSPQSYTYVNPSATPYVASFSPNVNIAWSDSNGFYSYGETAIAGNNGYLTYYGFKGPGSELLCPLQVEEFRYAPFSYLELRSVLLACTFTNSQGSGTRQGQSDLFYDGYGTLTINSNLYSSVARVFLEENYTDIVGTDSTVYHVENFFWFEINSMSLAFEINTTYVNNAVIDKRVRSYTIASGVNEVSHNMASIAITPNPATNEIKIAASKIESIEIFNTLREKVYDNAEDFGSNAGTSGTQPQTTNHKPQTIDVSKLTSGIYFVRVRTSDGISAAKFIKQ